MALKTVASRAARKGYNSECTKVRLKARKWAVLSEKSLVDSKVFAQADE